VSNVLDFDSGALASTGMRYHELALQAWLNRILTLRWGVPMPVVMSSPMDAFSEFTRLWAMDKNPYKYLLDAKDENGNPLYQPYPAPIRYPVISVFRKNYKLRQSHNFSIHNMRHIAWPTVSDDTVPVPGKPQQGTGLTRGDLGNVIVARYPMALDYRFQIDFFCNRPDTQSFFLNQLFREFWRTGGTQLQTWTMVAYPLIGPKLVRVYIDGDVENMTPETPEEGKNVEFRVSLTVVMEGYEVDLRYKVHPTLWSLVFNSGAAVPATVVQAFTLTSDMDFVTPVDLRGDCDTNPTVAYRAATSDMPPCGTYQPDTNNTLPTASPAPAIIPGESQEVFD